MTIGPILFSEIAWLNALAISILPILFAYKIRACEPTTNLFFLAVLIQ